VKRGNLEANKERGRNKERLFRRKVFLRSVCKSRAFAHTQLFSLVIRIGYLYILTWAPVAYRNDTVTLSKHTYHIHTPVTFRHSLSVT
jgi:hypothetical protein